MQLGVQANNAVTSKGGSLNMSVSADKISNAGRIIAAKKGTVAVGKKISLKKADFWSWLVPHTPEAVVSPSWRNRT